MRGLHSRLPLVGALLVLETFNGSAFAQSTRTIRLSGTVAAEKSLNILTPPLAGNRRASAPRNLGSSAYASAPASALGNAGATAATAAATSSLGTLRGTGNRFSGSALKPLSANTNETSGATSANGGMGSTSGSLSTTAGRNDGGPAGGEFQLLITKLVPAGLPVKKGATIAEFDRTSQLNRLDDYKASVLQFDASIAKLKASQKIALEAHDSQIENARADVDKAKLDLKTAEVRSAIEVEKLKLALEEAEAKYKQVLGEVALFNESQRAQMRVSEISRELSILALKRVERNIDRMVMKAPMDGIAVMKDIFRGGDFGQIQLGDQVWPGMPFMQIIDPKSMIVNAAVNQVDAEQIRLGMKAVIRLDAYPGVELPGHVIGLGAMTKPGMARPQFMREVPVRLKIDGVNALLIPDISASADILVETGAQR